MKKPIRFGIIGAARIAPNALIAAAKLVPEVEVAAIAARDEARARAFAAEHKVPRVHATYRDVIDDPEIDAIYNPLPNSHHCQLSIDALRAGKHVLCEKPMAANAVEAERMSRAARESGRVLGEAFHYHYHPLSERVRELIRSEAVGHLDEVEAHFSVPIPASDIRFDWKLAGGCTMDLGCYPLHMISHFTGLAPTVVRAKAQIVPENIDIAMEAVLQFEGGASARMTCSMAQGVRIGAHFTARGELGEIKVTNPVAPHIGHSLVIRTASGEKQETVAGDTTFTHQLRAFVAAVSGELPFATDDIEAIANMRLIDDVYRAAGLPPRGS